MKTLRQIARLAEAGRLASEGKITAPIKRIILPSDTTIETSGFFSISRSQALPYYVGRLPESWAFIQWAQPPDLSSSLLTEDAVARDIAALLSFVFHRRVAVADEVRVTSEGAAPTTFIPSAHKVDSRLYAPIASSPDAIWNTLRLILSMEDDHQFEAVAKAVRLYHSATLVADTDYSAGYLLLVAAVESLATEFAQRAVTFDEWSEARRWNKWIEELGLDEDTAKSLRQQLLDSRTVRLRQRFIDVGQRAATQEFWNLPWEMCFPKLEMRSGGRSRLIGLESQTDESRTPAAIQPARLRSLLANVYDHRSSLVHAGSAFPTGASLDLPTEVELDTQQLSGERVKVPLPSFSWFERLTWFAISECLGASDKRVNYELPDVDITPATF